MTVRIPLGGKHGGFALVDDEDAERVMQFRWWASPARRGRNDVFYAYRAYSHGAPYLMHRFILRPNAEEIIDHIDFDGLNNTRANLRVCTRSENNAHSRFKRPHPYRGIRFVKKRGKWSVRVQKNGVEHWGGHFDDPILAARQYDKMAKIHHGSFAILNFPESPAEASSL